jgi:fatty-acyl-CoA synthase
VDAASCINRSGTAEECLSSLNEAKGFIIFQRVFKSMQVEIYVECENMNELIRITIGDLLDKTAEQYPDNEAVVYTDREFRKTYSQFKDICDKAARGMMAMGIKKGDHVAIWATNYPEWLIAMFATAKIGAILVTVNTNYKIFELEYLLRQSDSSTLILIDGFKDSNYVEIINELCPEINESAPGSLKSKALPLLKNVIYIGQKKIPGMYNWNDLYTMADKISGQELLERQKALTLMRL